MTMKSSEDFYKGFAPGRSHDDVVDTYAWIKELVDAANKSEKFMSFFKRLKTIDSTTELPVEYEDLSSYNRWEVRQEYERRQKGLCYYCKGSLRHSVPADILEKPVTTRLYPKEFFDYPIHLHHDHESGLTLGAVHAYCNAVLWEHHNE